MTIGGIIFVILFCCFWLLVVRMLPIEWVGLKAKQLIYILIVLAGMLYVATRVFSGHDNPLNQTIHA